MDDLRLNTALMQNVNALNQCFNDCGDFTQRSFPLNFGSNLMGYVAYLDMLVNREIIEWRIIERIIDTNGTSHADNASNPSEAGSVSADEVFNIITGGGLAMADFSICDKVSDLCDAVLGGDTILLVDGCAKGIIVSTKGWPNRGIPTAENEVVVQGSQEAFTEVFRMNTSLLRRRIHDTRLKCKQLTLGKRSKSNVAMMYMSDLVRPEILSETEKRLNAINIDAVLDSGYVEQFIEDNKMSPFPQIQITERPDKAASAVLEGRIAIVVDNSPTVLIVPAVLDTFFQSSEDYYQRFMIMSFTRLIRYAAAFVSLILPGLYIAVTVFHPSTLPTLLILKMAGARQAIPFPPLIEILLMDLAFELLREAGIRLPGAVGGTIGIVGGIIVGQAAVEAGIVSPIVVIIAALTGISSFAIPNISLVSGLRLSKYLILFTSSLLGLFGFWVGVLLVIIHLISLKSFSIPYMFPYTTGEIAGNSNMLDSIFRAPLFSMKKRPVFTRSGAGTDPDAAQRQG